MSVVIRRCALQVVYAVLDSQNQEILPLLLTGMNNLIIIPL